MSEQLEHCQGDADTSQVVANEIRRAAFGGVNPIFPVSDLSASVEYFTKVLGFKLDWQAPGILASVSRGRCGIFLCQGDQGTPPTWVWIGVDDVEMLCEEYRALGAKIRHLPTNYPWALEMQVEDLDGNVMRLGSDPKDDEPSGPWLDMHGRIWRPKGDGWIKVDGDV